jgi:hypothetical protein
MTTLTIGDSVKLGSSTGTVEAVHSPTEVVVHWTGSTILGAHPDHHDTYTRRGDGRWYLKGARCHGCSALSAAPAPTSYRIMREPKEPATPHTVEVDYDKLAADRAKVARIIEREMGRPAGEPMDADEARKLTDQIKHDARVLWDRIVAAYLGRADIALGYGSWDEYTVVEFKSLRGLRLPREERTEVVHSLRHAGLPVRVIASATGLGVGTVHREIAAAQPESAVPNGTPDDVDESDAGGEPIEAEVVNEEPIATVIGIDGRRHPARKPPAETEPGCTLPAEEPVEPAEPTTSVLPIDIMALAGKVAARMDMLAAEVEALFTEAADAGMADEVEAMFDVPFRRLRDVMYGTVDTTPKEDNG